MITVQDLSKRFGQSQVLKDVNFSAQRGETVVLWGPNGAGKTTVLRCLLGILSFEGKLQVSGLDVASQGKQVRFQVGYVPQEINLHQDQSVWGTVLFYASLKKVKQDRAKALLDEWGLCPAAKQLVGHLSGGMKQKLALIIALLSNPSILFLDESTNHLDLKARHEFISRLGTLKQLGKTILLCSHRLSEVRKLADRVILLEAGKKVSEGKPDEARSEMADRALLSLTVSRQNCEKAAELIRRHGFSVQRNGTSVWIEVPLDRKIEPFQLLQAAAIPVLDFEMETEEELDEQDRP